MAFLMLSALWIKATCDSMETDAETDRAKSPQSETYVPKSAAA
jgi:hypothetical protein